MNNEPKNESGAQNENELIQVEKPGFFARHKKAIGGTLAGAAFLAGTTGILSGNQNSEQKREDKIAAMENGSIKKFDDGAKQELGLFDESGNEIAEFPSETPVKEIPGGGYEIANSDGTKTTVYDEGDYWHIFSEHENAETEEKYVDKKTGKKTEPPAMSTINSIETEESSVLPVIPKPYMGPADVPATNVPENEIAKGKVAVDTENHPSDVENQLPSER